MKSSSAATTSVVLWSAATWASSSTFELKIALCYLGWWRVERWILPYRAPARAVARTIVVVLIQIVSALIIVGVLYAAARA